MSLSENQVQQFESEGYLVVENFLTSQQVYDLKAEALSLKGKFNAAEHPQIFFETDESKGAKHIGEKYFLDSGDKISYFLEPKSKDSKETSVEINKIGHGLHLLSLKFKELSCGDRVQAIAQSLKFTNPTILQSMLIFKSAKVGGAVPPHQDSTFLHTEPVSAVGFWIPLDDCTLTNGCLYFWSKSHKKIPISKRFVRNQLPSDCEDPNLCGTTFEGEDYPKELLQQNEKEAIPAVIPAGSLVLIHGSIMHHSNANTSNQDRLAYTFHLVETKPGFVYDEKNWLQPTKEHPFKALY